MSFTPEEAFDLLNAIPSIEARIDALETIDYDFYADSQVNLILSWFYDDLETANQADLIAKIFLDRLGRVVICREETSCMKQFMTIMDCLHNDYRYEDYDSTLLLLKAFRKLKFRYAHECNPDILRRMYLDDKDYSDTFIKTPIQTNLVTQVKKRKQRSNEDSIIHALTKLKAM